MAFLFKRNPKTPSELIKILNDQIAKLDNTPSDRKKAQEECTRYLNQIKIILHGDDENIPQPDQINQLAQEIYSTDCLYLLVSNISNLEFDSRKDVTILFITLLRRPPTIDHLLNKKKILQLLYKSPEIPESSLFAGQIIRECIKYEPLARYLLIDNQTFWNYFEYVKNSAFEIATDSFSTLTDLLSVHKNLVSHFFANSNNLFQFIKNINNLLINGNYVTKRQSIKLLSDLILERSNNLLMTTFVSYPENLKLIMTLLSDRSKNIQLEAFNVFKVFVANPRKSKPVNDILIKNREKLITFFQNFNIDDRRENNKTLLDEKEFVLQQILGLPRIIPIQPYRVN
ncbi:Hym1p [Ascoidea rubescens DSM 1968]|uniref:Mo25-like protein n=1 Tax=Ascoidea rubescens DSM 1968 TaxID=1344418 RepID=A0A1D2VSK0_9ASCO|nr:Mo25-like protein [Ascoidea rubescens DSM 1968]ODV64558.1 Mo25-like protein [Ascoidea rubescens DSM 1968]